MKGGYVLDIPDEAAIFELTAAEARRKVRSPHAAWGDVIFEEGTVSNEQTQPVDEINVDEMDGLIINLHGATVSEEYLDVDGEVLLRLRNKMGSEFPIICTLDKHANISSKMFLIGKMRS